MYLVLFSSLGEYFSCEEYPAWTAKYTPLPYAAATEWDKQHTKPRRLIGSKTIQIFNKANETWLPVSRSDFWKFDAGRQLLFIIHYFPKAQHTSKHEDFCQKTVRSTLTTLALAKVHY